MSRRFTLVPSGAFALFGAVLVGCPGTAGVGGATPYEAPAPVATSSVVVDRQPAAPPVAAAHGADHGSHSRGSTDHQDSSTPAAHGGHGERGHDGGHHGSGGRDTGNTLRRPGEEVQDFTVTNMTGETLRLGSLRRTADTPGKIVVLTFWCTTCHSCRDIEREFDAKAKAYAAEGARFLMVASNYTDSSDRVNQFLQAKGLGFTVLLDPEGEIANYFGATLTTTTAVIDVEGRLRYYGDFGGAPAAVRNLIAGEQVAVPERPADG
jgi:peroxiredoxin